MVVRKQFSLSIDLDVLRRSSQEERQRALASPLIALSPEHQRELEEFQSLSLEEAQERHKSLSKEVIFQLSLLGTREQAEDPYWFSDLPKWLEFESWKPRDAMLLLSGVSPAAAIVDWTYENFMGAVIDSPRIRAATDLDAIYDHYDLPERSAYAEDVSDVKKQLREGTSLSATDRAKLTERLASLERLRDDPVLIRRETQLQHRSHILGELSGVWFSGEHDAERRYTPEHFMEWARIRGFVPEWYEWAVSRQLLGVGEFLPSTELFDPDAEDYPELLHIAVHAWEHARKATAGTPKQRIERFLAERYPKLSSNARDGIAQVANWQRLGGRPKS
jgi:hypothetical protein